MAKKKRKPITDAQVERFGIFVEECGEALQIVGKIQRHGLLNRNPTIEKAQTNRRMLEKEIGHILNSIKLLIEAGDVREEVILKAAAAKAETIEPWLYYTKE